VALADESYSAKDDLTIIEEGEAEIDKFTVSPFKRKTGFAVKDDICKANERVGTKTRKSHSNFLKSFPPFLEKQNSPIKFEQIFDVEQ
jgi:hypothetical protein